MRKYLFIVLLVGFGFNQDIGLINQRSKLKTQPKGFSKSLPITVSIMDTVIILSDSTDKYYHVKIQDFNGWIKKDKVTKIVQEESPVLIPKKVNNKKLVKKKIEEKKVKNERVTKKKQRKISKKVEDKKESPPKEKSSDQASTLKQNPSLQDDENNGSFLYFILLILSTLGLAYLSTLFFLKYKKIEKRFKPVVDIDKELDKVNKEYDNLRGKYKKAKLTYNNLRIETDKLSDDLDMMSNGLYEPKYDFGTSDQYKEKIKSIRDRQKTLIRTKQAIPAVSDWTINNSKREGKKFINRQIRIALRAFNGECDSIFSKVRWNNIDRMVERIERSADAIDKLLETSNMYISDAYSRSKINELYAVHEYLEKKHDEQEEIRRVRAQEREEKKVLQEIEKAKKEAEKEEKLFNEALEKAKKQLGLLSGDELAKQEDQIKMLENQLSEALEKKERAISRAQLTKSGHVYVISNIGSFGEDIYKIGLTRRLDPEIRVRELGDASVPFSFDIHAMIFSEDAPALEKQLHERFNSSRVNLVNRRKEYFKLDLETIKDAVLEVDSEADFISTIESREYKETKSILTQKQKQLDELEDPEEEKFPEEI